MRVEDYDPLYVQGVKHFNEGFYFEAHEVWEELWIAEPEPTRSFYKGLIQASVALHHFESGNALGAHKLLHGARALLGPFRPRHLGLDVRRFLKDLTECLASVREAPQRGAPTAPLDRASAPRIALEPAPVAAPR